MPFELCTAVWAMLNFQVEVNLFSGMIRFFD
jgi:hypothetical protein